MDSPAVFSNWQREGKTPRLRAVLGAAAVFMAVAAFWWQAAVWYEHALMTDQKDEVRSLLFSYGTALATAVNERIALLEGVAALTKIHPDPVDLSPLFETFARGLSTSEAGIRAIQAFPQDAPVIVFPVETNEVVLGRTLDDLINDERPEVRTDVRRAIESKGIAISGPYELRQGGLGLVARMPVFHGEEFWGLVSIVVDIPPILSDSGLPQAATLSVAVRDRSGKVFFGNAEILRDETVTYIVNLHDGSWQLSARPAGGWSSSYSSALNLFRLISLLVVILTTILAYTLIRRHTRLAIDARTSSTMLQQSNARYQQLFDSSSDALFLLGRDGTIRDANQAASERYGYSREELLHMTVADLAADDLRGQVPEKIGSVIERPVRFFWRHRRKDGTFLPVEISSRALELEGEKHLLSSVRDMTAHVLAEEALRASEKRYRKLISEMTAGFALFEVLRGGDSEPIDLRFLEINKAFETLTQVSADHLIGKTVRQVLPSSAAQWIRTIERTASTGRPERLDIHLDTLGKDFEGVIYCPEEGQVATVFSDVTDRKQAEQALRQNEARFRAAYEQAAIGIGELSAEGKWISANQRLCTTLGYSLVELLNLPPQATSLPEDREQERREFSELLRGERAFHSQERQFIGKNQTLIWVEITLSVIHPVDGKPPYLICIVENISLRKAAEESLSIGSEFLSEVIEKMAIGVAQIETETGRFLKINKRYCDVIGYSVSELNHMTFQELSYPEDLELDLQQMDRLRQGQIREFSIEKRYLHKQGHLVWVSLTVLPLWEVGEEPTNHIAIVEDITERRQAEEALIASEQKFRALVEQSITGIYVFQEDRFLYVNKRFAEMFGYTEQEVIATLRPTDVVEVEERPQALDRIRQRLSGEVQSVHYIARGKHKEGKELWIEIHGSRILLDGVPTITGTVLDITERKNSETAIRRSNERLAILHEIDRATYLNTDQQEMENSLLERLSHLIPFSSGALSLLPEDYSQSTDWRIVSGAKGPLESGTVTRITSLSLKNQLSDGKSLNISDLRDLSVEKDEGIDTLIHSGIRSMLLVPMVQSDERIGTIALFSESVSAFNAEHREILTEVANQCSIVFNQARLTRQIEQQNIELEHRVRQRTQDLELANKELEAFAYSVSHDLRAPLRAIEGFSLAVMEDAFDLLPPETRDSLQRVRAATQRMNKLIDGLLRLSRITRTDLNRATVDLSQMFQTFADELRNSAGSRTVDFQIQPDLVGNADVELVRILIENLLRNAWKFTGKQAKARIEFGAFEQNGESVYFIRDDGAGFDMAYIESLFGVFQRLHPASEFEGTGIGLAIVQRIVHRHGGRVWAEGQVAKGATFYFTLPAPTT